MTIPVLATVVCGQTPQPHAGWEEGRYSPVMMRVSYGMLTASAQQNYLVITNVLAPRIYTKGVSARWRLSRLE
jgi:hypothetical protein